MGKKITKKKILIILISIIICFFSIASIGLVLLKKLNTTIDTTKSDTKINLENLQSKFDKNINIDHYSNKDKVLLENKIKQIFSNLIIKNIKINKEFDQNSNLFLVVDLCIENKNYKLYKKLNDWTIEDLSVVFDYKLDNNNNIFLTKLKNNNIVNLKIPNNILLNNLVLKINKITSSLFNEKLKSLDISLIDNITFDQNIIFNNVNTVIFNIDDNNFKFIKNCYFNEVWINNNNLTKQISISANKLFLDSENVNNKFISSTYSEYYQKYNKDNMFIIYKIKSNNKIDIISLKTKIPIDAYYMFDYLIVNNKKYFVDKLLENSLSEFNSKNIFMNNLVIKNNSVFQNNYYLQKIYLSNKQTVLYDNLFCNCTNLKEIINTNNIQEIKHLSLYNCKSLQYLFLTRTINNIDDLSINSLDQYYFKIIYFYKNNDDFKYIKNKKVLCPIVNIESIVNFIELEIINNVFNIVLYNDINFKIPNFVFCENKIYKLNKITFNLESNIEKIDIPFYCNELIINKNFSVNFLNLPCWFDLTKLTLNSCLIKNILLPKEINTKVYTKNLYIPKYSEWWNINWSFDSYNLKWYLPKLNYDLINKIEKNNWINENKNCNLMLINNYKNNDLKSLLKILQKYFYNIQIINNY